MNSVILTGRLTNDPELAYTPTQTAVCKFTLAVDRIKKTEEQTADFIRITVWSAQAENCKRYLKKGSKCGVQGRIQTGSYPGKDGKKVYTTDVVADRVEFLDSKPKETPRNPETTFTEREHGFVEADVSIPF